MTFVLEGIPAILWALSGFSLCATIRIRRNDEQGVLRSSGERAGVGAEDAAAHGELPGNTAVHGVLLLCAQYFCWSAGIYGFVLWLPTMDRSGVGARD